MLERQVDVQVAHMVLASGCIDVSTGAADRARGGTSAAGGAGGGTSVAVGADGSTGAADAGSAGAAGAADAAGVACAACAGGAGGAVNEKRLVQYAVAIGMVGSADVIGCRVTRSG